MANFVVLQAIYAKIVESIQARRIRVELSIAYQKPEERGVESRRKREVVKFGRIMKFSQPIKFHRLRIFAGCEIASCCHYSPPATVHPINYSFLLPVYMLNFVPLFGFLPILSPIIAFDFGSFCNFAWLGQYKSPTQAM